MQFWPDISLFPYEMRQKSFQGKEKVKIWFMLFFNTSVAFHCNFFVYPSELNLLDRLEPLFYTIIPSVFFFRFLDPNSNQFFRLTQRNFEANSAFFSPNSKFRRFWTSIFTNSYNFLHLAQIFGIFKQNQLNLSLNQIKSWPNSAKY